MDMQAAGGLDEIIEDLEAIIEDLNRDPIGSLTIYSEHFGEYIAAYDIDGDTVVWKIPHFSLYYFRRR